jgi:hypothetical protein
MGETFYKEVVTIIGAMLVFFVGIANLIILFKTNKKNSFIGSITEKRFDYINKYREIISQFCSIAFIESDLKTKEIEKLKNDIVLNLNPSYKEWDCRIIELVHKIIECDDIHNRKSIINDLIIISQFMLKLEWEGAQLESKKGILKDHEKEKLRNINLDKYKSYTKNEND